MSVQTSVKVEGFDELFKAMDQLSQEIGKGKTDSIWRKSLQQAFDPVLQSVKLLAPRDTGQLADHIYIKVHRPQSRDKNSKYYENEVWMARVTISPRRDDSVKNTVLTKRGTFREYYQNKPVALSQEFGNARTAAQPFIRTSLERNVDKVIERLGKIIWAEVNWGKYAKKG